MILEIQKQKRIEKKLKTLDKKFLSVEKQII